MKPVKKKSQKSVSVKKKPLTSGLKPLVKAFMRLRVVPSSTPLQFNSTLNNACVAQEFGINCQNSQNNNGTNIERVQVN